MPYRTDIQETVTVTGNSVALDTSGYGQVSFTADISSLSGAGAYVQVEIQASDDGTNYNTVHTTRRITANGAQRISGIRISSQFYRYVWFIGGTTPSASLKITTTLKDYSPTRTSSMLRYDDMNLKTLSATSSVFSSFSNTTVGVVLIREDAIASVGQIRIQASNDGIFWADSTGDIPVNPSSTSHRCLDGTTHRFFRFIVTTAVSGVGASTLHAFWSATGGA